jgi:hypothetical protein
MPDNYTMKGREAHRETKGSVKAVGCDDGRNSGSDYNATSHSVRIQLRGPLCCYRRNVR